MINAHGSLQSITIDGTTYIGNIPHVTSFASPIRAIDDITPVKGASNRDLNCGKNAQIAQMVVDAKPGSELSFNWISGDNETPVSSIQLPYGEKILNTLFRLPIVAA